MASLCKGKSVKAPNKCRKLKGCKVASGKKRTFCRKKKNSSKKTAKRRRTTRRLPEIARLKGYNKKTYNELRKLGVL